MSLWVPPRVSQELRAQTENYRQELLQARRLHGILDDWNRDLKAIDPYLELAWFNDDVQVVGVIPGRFHVIRHNPGAPPTPIPITGDNGEYVEPTSRLFDKLRENDMWHAEANYDRRKRMAELERQQQKRKEQEAEERLDEIQGRLKAATRTSVSMNRDSAWSQNHAGRRGVR